jgi:hypothetical protein
MVKITKKKINFFIAIVQKTNEMNLEIESQKLMA